MLEPHTLDENILVPDLRDGCALIELEGIEAAPALNRPLLSRRWCHAVWCDVLWIYLVDIRM